MHACCPECDKLCPATPGEFRAPGSRERVYRVAQHRKQACPPPCGEIVKFIHDGTLTDSGFYLCANGHRVTEESITQGPPCNGHRSSIR